jgi:hypothetical protein
MKVSSGKTYVVTNAKKEQIPSQVTYDGKLIFQTSIKVHEKLAFFIGTGAHKKFPPLTYGRYIKERKDDFAWENDRVAFRIYGPALIATDGPSNGIDVWYKRTNALIIDKWYKDDIAKKQSYHEDHGEGLDDYKVGRTLGAGAMAPFINDSLLILNENYVSQELLENGPIRTTFRLTYKDLDINGKNVSEKRTFSLDAGSQLTKVTQEYGTSDTLIVAAGIVKREGKDEIYESKSDYGTSAIIYVEPENSKVGNVFIGLVFPEGLEECKSINSHVIGITKYYPSKPVTYYTGYGWEKFGFPSITDFQNYIELFTIELEQPLKISFVK